MNNTQKIGWFLGSILLMALYVNGAVRHSEQVNTDVDQGDQGAYLDYAKSMVETNYDYVGRRNRMPVYPFLQSILYDSDLSDAEFFIQGKRLNIILSLILLPVIFWLLHSYLPFFASVVLTLISAFTLFIFKAGYFQAEILFYFLIFCCFLLLIKMLHRPLWYWGVLTGVLLGLTHLTKAAVVVALGLFVIVALLQEGYKLYQKKDNAGARSFATNLLQRNFKNYISIALVPVVFLATIYPYISTSKRIFGSYFYNVNTTFYIWYDSWDEVVNGTRAHGDRVGWPNMPPEEIPSPSKYLREHTASQISFRFIRGVAAIAKRAIMVTPYSSPYGYFKYFAIYFLFCSALAISNYHHTYTVVRKYPFISLYVFTYFTVYLLLYAWYTRITHGNRLVLAQFLPVMFTLSFIIFRLYSKKLNVFFRGKQINLANLFLGGITILVFSDIFMVLSGSIVKIYGGS